MKTNDGNSNRRRFSDYVDDRPKDGVFLVDRAVYNDPDILEAEYRNIFEADWVFLCHESHVPNPGDFFATHIGRQPVFVVRKPDGTLGCYLNACGHRGAMLVNARTGNTKRFICPYHGFCFDTGGKCISVTAPKTGWSEARLDMTEFDLTPVARLDSYRGLVFGSLSADVSSLRDHLGAAMALIDNLVAPAPQELEIVAGFSIYQTACNWKIMHENGPDAYHGPVVHNNFMQAVTYREQRESRSGVTKTDTARFRSTESASYALGNGHTAFWHKRPNPESFPIYAQKDELEKKFTPGQLEWILGRGRHMTIFPNLLINDLASTHLRCYRPLSVDRMETMIWCLAPVGEPTEMRAARLRKFEDFFLPSGMATPDDVAVAESAQKASLAFNSKWTSMGRGIESEFHVAGPDAAARELGMNPDISTNNWQHEIALQGIYRRWLQLLQRGEGLHRG